MEVVFSHLDSHNAIKLWFAPRNHYEIPTLLQPLPLLRCHKCYRSAAGTTDYPAGHFI